MKRSALVGTPLTAISGYAGIHAGIINLLESARHASARAVNALLTATYWEIGRRIVEAEQGGKRRADYGERLIERLAAGLTRRFGRGFGRCNLFQVRAFYLAYPDIMQIQSAKFDSPKIRQMPSGAFIADSVSGAATKGFGTTWISESLIRESPDLFKIADCWNCGRAG